jgi:SOS-response transcriptional repressor LexA
MAHLKDLRGDSVGSRIKAARLAKGLTQTEFAASLGIVQGFLSGIERGKKTPSDTLLIAFCHHYKINEEWLFTGTGEMFREYDATDKTGKDSQTTQTPLFDKVPEGFPEHLNHEGMNNFVLLPGIPEGCCAMVAYGDFMAPTIRDGDLVIFSTQENLENGDIVLANNRWGDAILRRYRLKDREPFLVSDNPVYSPFRPDTETKMIGKVVEVWRKIKV